MKYIISSLLLLFIGFHSFAQPLRVHVAGGFSNYRGDLQESKFSLEQAKGVISAGATFNLTEKFALRSDYSFAKISGDDKYSTPSRAPRNLNFTSWIKEFSLLGEYDILNTYDHRFTPYVFAGVGVFRFSPYTHSADGKKVYLHPLRTEGQGTSRYPEREHYKRTQLNIPFGGGVKYALSDDIHLALELSFRKLFTDYLDDVSTTYADETVLLNEVGPTSVAYAFRGDEMLHNPYPFPGEGKKRGSPEYKDSYYFGQLRISFRLNWFEEAPAFGGGRTRKSQVGCPSRIW